MKKISKRAAVTAAFALVLGGILFPVTTSIPSASAAVTSVDDSVTGTGANQFSYTGTWTHCSSGCQAGLYNATQSWTNTTGGTASIVFSGTNITLYSLTNNGSGIANVQICDATVSSCGTAAQADLYSATQTGNNQVYDSGTLVAGTHSLKVTWTGTHNASSSGNYVNIDRVAINSSAALAGTYYVDNSTGCSNAVTTPTMATPWCDFTNLNGNSFSAGASILLKRGDTWNQELGKLYGGGTSGSPVTIGAYGTGARPIINRNGNASDRAVWVEDGDNWTVRDLEVKHSGMGIVFWYTTLGHEGLDFEDLYLHDITGVFAQSPAQSDLPGLYDSTGLYISGSAPQPSASQWIIRNIAISTVEATDTNDPVDISGWGGFLSTYPNTTVQNVTISNTNWYSNRGCPNFDNISNVVVVSSRWNNNGSQYQSVGTTNMFWWMSSHISIVNSDLGLVAATGSPDMTGGDFEAYDDHASILGNYIHDDAGPGLEFLALGRTADYNSNHLIADNALQGNGGAGQVWVYSSATSGTVRNNFYTSGTNLTSPTPSSWTVSNNIAALGTNLYPGEYNFSATQGANQWSYQWWNGSSVANFAAYDSTNGYWGSSSNYLSRFDALPSANASQWTIRTWTAPRAGTVNVVGHIIKNQLGGDGVSFGITKNGSWFSGYPSSLGASDQAGYETNLTSIAVAAGDQLQFQVNAGSSGNNTDDLTSWDPIVAYQ